MRRSKHPACTTVGSHTDQLRKELTFRKVTPLHLHLRSTFSPWRIFRFSTKHAFLFEGHSVQSLSRAQLFLTPWTAARQASLPITNSQGSLKLMSESVMPSNHLILCRPLLLPPSIFPSIRVFSSQSVLLTMWSSIYDYWKDHSFDYMDLCRQSNVSVFYYAV